ncbi:MAG: hypothetical protein K2X08_05195 [Chlamydiales bacterium]|nr:hypothetical protein [Chlamydiales bacterium]
MPGLNLNPWRSMWVHPRKTIRWVVNSNPRYGVFCLSTIYILQTLFTLFNFWSLGFKFSHYILLIPSILLAPFLGVIWISLYGRILQFISRLFGGHAPRTHLQAALAWSRLPMVLSLLLWGGLWLNHPHQVFIQYGPGPLVVLLHAGLFILHLWTIILFIQAVREVQRFNLLKTISTIFISWTIYSLIILLTIFSIKILSIYLSSTSAIFFN